jgi:hypothetical protein
MVVSCLGKEIANVTALLGDCYSCFWGHHFVVRRLVGGNKAESVGVGLGGIEFCGWVFYTR